MAAIRGQRVLIFGDSLSHRGATAASPQVEVREGTSRTSSVPGDLLASHFLEMGAAAARLDAKVSRSAHNFFRIENANTLLAADQAWKPTLAIVFLGTNDLGLNMDIDAVSMAKIRDAFRAVGADVWAVGPPSFAAEKYSSKAPGVVAMMKSVFGANRFIDAQPLTTDLIYVGRSSDGVHFTSLGAKTFASRLAAVFRAALDTNVSPTVAVSTTAPTMPASTARTELHPFVKGFGYGLAALAFVGVGVVIKRRMTRSRAELGAVDRKQITKELRQWDKLRQAQGTPKARKPVWFVDPDSGDLIEVDYETAVFRGALDGLPAKKADLRKMFAQALKTSEGDKRNQGTWEAVGDTGWEVRHFNVPSKFGYSKHVELRKIGHHRSTTFGKSYVNSVSDQIFTGNISSTWIDQEDLKGPPFPKLTKRNSATIRGQLWYFKARSHWKSDRIAKRGGIVSSSVDAIRVSDGRTVTGSSRASLEKVIAERIDAGIYAFDKDLKGPPDKTLKWSKTEAGVYETSSPHGNFIEIE